MKNFGPPIVSFAFLGLIACVPKTEYEDQEARLRETKEKLKELEINSEHCDPDTMIQLREQAQSLDLLSQELVDRNTELSKEISRLRPLEAQMKLQDQAYRHEIEKSDTECEAKLQRTRETYEDLLKELRREIQRLKADLEAKNRVQKAKKTPSTP